VRKLYHVVQRVSALHGKRLGSDAQDLRPLLDPRAARIEGPTGPTADLHELAVRRAVDALPAVKGRLPTT
jgi:hypothetical protein